VLGPADYRRLAWPRSPILRVHPTFAGMNSAGFFLAMSATTCAYFAVMRGSAWPRKSCTAGMIPAGAA
jgi:hypothetical protein